MARDCGAISCEWWPCVSGGRDRRTGKRPRRADRAFEREEFRQAAGSGRPRASLVVDSTDGVGLALRPQQFTFAPSGPWSLLEGLLTAPAPLERPRSPRTAFGMQDRRSP